MHILGSKLCLGLLVCFLVSLSRFYFLHSHQGNSSLQNYLFIFWFIRLTACYGKCDKIRQGNFTSGALQISAGTSQHSRLVGESKTLVRLPLIERSQITICGTNAILQSNCFNWNGQHSDHLKGNNDFACCILLLWLVVLILLGGQCAVTQVWTVCFYPISVSKASTSQNHSAAVK